MKIQDDKYEERNAEKQDDPSFAKKYRKDIMRKMVQKGVSYQVEKEQLNIKQNITEVTEEMIGEKKKTE